MEWDSNQRRWQQIERRLNEIGCLVKGSQNFAADRVADLLEQIDELRQELKRVADTQEKLIKRLKVKFGANEKTADG